MTRLRDFGMGILKSITRVVSQVRKELIQVRRRPGAFFSLVLGPFLIMAMFGLGYTGIRRPLDTVIVVPPDLPLPRDIAYYEGLGAGAINVLEVTDDGEAARNRLRGEDIDVVVVAPTNMSQTFRSGQQAQIGVEINEVDPVNAAYAQFLAGHITQAVNREILTRAIEEGETYAVGRLGQEVTEIPPEVIAAPTTSETTNVAPSQPNVVTYFGPAVLALILQHMAVTLSALSFVRERLSGAMELFRISPVNSFELVLGKYLGLGLVSAVIAGITTVLLVGVLGVPLLGDPLLLAAVVTLLVVASLGVGLLISVISDSERQAVQLSLLVLLASVFFSGFVLPVDEFRAGVQWASYTLPVTHGIRLLQDVMLRGSTNAWWQLGLLAVLALVLFVLTALVLRRVMRHA
ncbi:MAG TPA: ABC transporter permease [Candidatus Caenarcaniphilales bacterium]|nr:ABC transporter permease [Candidatus Caenarcaniphilales bacterium]